ncbi:hypothetical protein DFJ77DRAFT_178202 [Powellomyces hirtus]|nr:hypothetical protein DFJ77DRAFT_178202 [Powellomyces hirtus]
MPHSVFLFVSITHTLFFLSRQFPIITGPPLLCAVLATTSVPWQTRGGPLSSARFLLPLQARFLLPLQFHGRHEEGLCPLRGSCYHFSSMADTRRAKGPWYMTHCVFNSSHFDPQPRQARTTGWFSRKRTGRVAPQVASQSETGLYRQQRFDPVQVKDLTHHCLCTQERVASRLRRQDAEQGCPRSSACWSRLGKEASPLTARTPQTRAWRRCGARSRSSRRSQRLFAGMIRDNIDAESCFNGSSADFDRVLATDAAASLSLIPSDPRSLFS